MYDCLRDKEVDDALLSNQYMIQQYLKTNKPKKCRTSYRDTAASKDVMKRIKSLKK